MLKFLNYIFVIGPLLIWYYPQLLYYRIRKDKISKIKLFRRIKKLAKIVSNGLHIKINVIDNNNLLALDSFLLVGNHQSMYDPIVVLASSKDTPIYFVAKKESEKIPLFGMFIRIINGIFLDRGNRRQEVKVMKEIKARLREDSCAVCIYPEGTRTKNENYILNEFHPGTFNVAMKEKKPIVPFVCEGSYNAFKLSNKLRSKCYIKYLKPLYYEDYKDLSTFEVANLLQKRIQEEQIKLHELMK